MTFRVMLRMEIEPGRETDFERVWREGSDAVTGHPASLGQSLSRSTGEESTYYIVSDWVDEKQFREFENSPAHLEHRATLHPFRRNGSFHTMELVERIEGRAVGRAG
ncbi:antibiotic biosynthesis monooxygenase [Streptomyces hygroscopicus]|uniref:antibiotic biosynthesis monooxygenase family protein n=1 Tax=Streptomyces hygroscopicus TaxID=1912 RepID=UPI00223FEDEB|nr:antibiotic biosynthesis monooxygenase family protein [Streptomyces hygroscopicus]MCW7945628.1 antibiotic biosynthesis monooxygenase [Streptomyces hygroscopicus]